MKEKGRSDDQSIESESSLTLSDRFHPYKKKQQMTTSPPIPSRQLNTSNNRRVERSLMNTQRIFASTSDESTASSFLHLENFKKAIHTTYSSSSSQEEVVEAKNRCTELDISKDINLVREEDFEFLDNIDFSDCLELEMFDFDQSSFSINKATSLDGVSTSCQSSPDIFLKPRCKEPSIEWDNHDDDLFQIITPTSPSNREISTLELLLETPLENLLYHNVDDKE